MTEFAFATDTLAEDPQRGMTLRDYFAAQALAGLLAKNTAHYPEWIAKRAYEHADEMLKARARAKTTV